MRLRWVLYFVIALVFFGVGAYGFRTFELISKALAFMELFARQNPTHSFFSKWIIFALPALQALLLSLCFAPMCLLLLKGRVRWYGTLGAVTLGCLAVQYSQQFSYLSLAQSQPRSNQCPWISASGLAYFVSQLETDLNNEQCAMLRLAHDYPGNWDRFKERAYDPAYLPAHYSQNVVFPLAVMASDFLAKKEEIAQNPHLLRKWWDQTVLGYSMLQALVFVLEHQDRKIKSDAPGSNPASILISKLLAWEEAWILKRVSDTLLVHLQSMFVEGKIRLAETEKEHPESKSELSGYESDLNQLARRWKSVSGAYAD